MFGDVISGLFGIGEVNIIVPALLYWAGFPQHKATEASLAVMLLMHNPD
jgi:uncharacterized protein